MKKRDRKRIEKARRHGPPANVADFVEARIERDVHAPMAYRVIPEPPHPDDVIYPRWLLDATRGYPDAFIVGVLCCGLWYRSDRRPPIARRSELVAFPPIGRMAPKKLDRALAALVHLGLAIEVRLEQGARAYQPSPDHPDLVPSFDDVARLQATQQGGD